MTDLDTTAAPNAQEEETNPAIRSLIPADDPADDQRKLVDNLMFILVLKYRHLIPEETLQTIQKSGETADEQRLRKYMYLRDEAKIFRVETVRAIEAAIARIFHFDDDWKKYMRSLSLDKGGAAAA